MKIIANDEIRHICAPSAACQGTVNITTQVGIYSLTARPGSVAKQLPAGGRSAILTVPLTQRVLIQPFQQALQVNVPLGMCT